MFGRKKAEASTRAAHEAERKAKTGKFRDKRLASEAKARIAARMSPSEKTRIQANSRAEQRKSTPSV
jgi:hypothetical protein